MCLVVCGIHQSHGSALQGVAQGLQGRLILHRAVIARWGHVEFTTMQLAYQSPPAVQRDRLLRLPAVEQATGLRKTTVYALMRRGEFPPCVHVTTRCVAWPESKVLQWVQDRIAASGA